VRAAAALITLGSTACFADDTPVALRVTYEGAPVDSLEVLLVPVDVQSILDSLRLAAPYPMPAFDELERELVKYRPANPRAVDSLRSEWARARREVAALADSLSKLPRESAAYDTQYRRFRDLYVDLSKNERAFELRFRELVGDARGLATRAVTASDSLRRWEANVYGPIDALSAAAMLRIGRHDTVVVTDHEGRAALRLPPGAWWLVARTPHPANPFMEYYWNVPFVVNPLVPVTVPATERHSVERWRH
jgi:hypothetical protein